MIQGVKKKDLLSREYVLGKVSQKEIFERLMGPFEIGESFKNVLRGEKHESAIIRSFLEGGEYKLKLKDYGDSSYNGDCFDLLQKVYGCNFYEALEIVDRDFNLSAKPVIYTASKAEKTYVPPPIFHIITKPFTQEELKWWGEYHQGLEDLKRENIYSPKEIWRNRKKIPITLMTFVYAYHETNTYKLYRPHGKIGKKVWYHERKWDSNVPNDLLENKEGIKECDKAFLTTSKKDRMVLQKALKIDCIANIQAENIAAINDEDMQYIKQNSLEQIICGDGDQAGLAFSSLLEREYNFKPITPESCLVKQGIKDYAEWGRQKGLKEIRNHFSFKKLI